MDTIKEDSKDDEDSKDRLSSIQVIDIFRDKLVEKI